MQVEHMGSWAPQVMLLCYVAAAMLSNMTCSIAAQVLYRRSIQRHAAVLMDRTVCGSSSVSHYDAGPRVVGAQSSNAQVTFHCDTCHVFKKLHQRTAVCVQQPC
jgi:hypothetical protein